MDYRKCAQEIYDLVGKRENLVSAAHCATRLRLVTNDNDKVDMKKLEDVDGVKGVFSSNGQLQIIIGMNDPTCVPQHSLQFLNACAEAGTQPDFFVYPGEGHNMAGHKSVHLHERITQYFEDYLK